MSKSITEIREMFLDFFHSKDHKIVASSCLIPNNDSTLLFTNAGMNQFKDVFLGLEQRNYSRATTSQRCVRAGGKHTDLEKVGYTARHHTFFEMLGNFSFGDYFKYDAIHYAWELLTSKKLFNLFKERLWVTVYKSDNETYEIWEKNIGIPREHIIRIGDNKGAPYASDNFWQMGNTGPCGPCTEIFYDHGNHIPGAPPGNNNKKNGNRYIEIWNLVFMQFNRQADGTMEPLPKQSVDTGMGLERIAAVLQHVNSNYDTDIFRKLIASVAKIIGTTDLNNKSLQVIADHIRSCAFLIADGVIPSNENRGYALRRIIRRAVRHGNLLGTKKIFFYKLVEPLIQVMDTACENLKQQQEVVEKVLKIEEEQFTYTLERGLALLEKNLTKLSGDTLDGKTAFRLYDTYGFPIDLTIEVCREHNIKVDEIGFNKAMQEQRRHSRQYSHFNADYNYHAIHINYTSEFHGYNCLELKSIVIALFVDCKTVNSISAGQEGVVIIDKTPFYAESGGQVGDQGELKGNNFHFKVLDTQKHCQAIYHIGTLTFGTIKIGDTVQANVNKERRTRICLNHSATHLMHAALRKILGPHVLQKGSLVNDKMLRFDFSHFKEMKLSEIRAVEDLVNIQIRRNLSIKTQIIKASKAKEINKTKNLRALLNKQHNELVRLLSINDFSIELCSGTHASRTGDIGLFYIISESSSAAGVRRIEALTGEGAIANLHAQNDQLNDISQLLKSNTQNLSQQIHNMLKHTRQLEHKLQKLKERITVQECANLFIKAIDIKGIQVIVTELLDIETKALQYIVKNLKNQLGSVVIVLATITNGKVALITGVSKNITNHINALELITMVVKQIGGGKGRGNSEIAYAGGTDINALPRVLTSVKNWVIKRLGNY